MSTTWRGGWARLGRVPGHWGDGHEGLLTFVLVFRHPLGDRRQLLVPLVKERSPSGHTVCAG